MPSRSGSSISGRTSVSTVNSRSWPSSSGHRGDVDLGLADGADVLGLGGLGEEAREGLVDGLLDHGAAADALVDDPARDLALAEARDLHLRPRSCGTPGRASASAPSNGTSTVSLTRVGLMVSTALFTSGTPQPWGNRGNFGSDAVRAGPCGPAPSSGARARGTPDRHRRTMLAAVDRPTQSGAIPPRRADAWVPSRIRARPDAGAHRAGRTAEEPHLHPHDQANAYGLIADSPGWPTAR